MISENVEEMIHITFACNDIFTWRFTIHQKRMLENAD